jgi:hypothetical protein
MQILIIYIVRHDTMYNLLNGQLHQSMELTKSNNILRWHIPIYRIPFYFGYRYKYTVYRETPVHTMI